MPSILGIDSGLTVTKAVLFDTDGRVLAVTRRRLRQSMPVPHRVERDMLGLWAATAEAIAEAISAAGVPASDIIAVAATGHGDGIYLLDAECRPLGPAILSLDSRAGAVVDAWSQQSVADEALALTGQTPHASAPSALLAWIKAHEPDRYRRIAHAFACKDWLRFCLTGAIGTDRTEASTSFTDVRNQGYAPEALRLFGLDAMAYALPPIGHPCEIAGRVTPAAAARTGLATGTPVAFGLHDVTASALGIGGHAPGRLAIVAGTYSINEIVASAPRVDARWFCRNAVAPGLWNCMAISPASAANYDWFVDTLCGAEQRAAMAAGRSVHGALSDEMAAAASRPSSVLFHPFLFGSPHGPAASGAFLGLRAWHDRGTMLRAVLEGIAFNHRVHVDALRGGFDVDEARLTGGASRSPVFAQMMADILGIPVRVAATEEAAAWGAALCAGTAVGLHRSPQDGSGGDDRRGTVHVPDAVRHAAYAERFRLFRAAAEALAPLWPELTRLGEERE